MVRDCKTYYRWNGLELITNRGALKGMCVAQQPRQDAAANENAFLPKWRSRGLLRTSRCCQVVVEFVSCISKLKVVRFLDRFAPEYSGTRHSMMSFPCPPPPMWYHIYRNGVRRVGL